MPNERIVRLPRLHRGQTLVRSEARRWNVVACGRRWGKTLLGRDLAVRAALAGDPVAWGAPGYRFLAENYRALKRCLTPVLDRANDDEKRLELVGGGSIEFWTLMDENAGRGRSYRLWILDEAAMVPRLGDVFMESVRPTLSDLGGEAWFLSTPKGRGFFWESFMRGQDPEEPDWASWQRPSSESPWLGTSELESARRMMPERAFRQEYLAEFLDSEGQVFRRLDESVDSGRCEGLLAAEDGRRYQAGVDLARVRDFTVVTVVDDLGRQVWFSRVRGLSWERQVEDVARICRLFSAVAVVDATGVGDPICERMVLAGVDVVPFKFTSLSKQALMENLALRLDEGSLRLMDVPVQTAEMVAFEYESLPGGGVRMAGADGGHDDCVCALALAVWPVKRVRLDVF